jgi:hypothetical protein
MILRKQNNPKKKVFLALIMLGLLAVITFVLISFLSNFNLNTFLVKKDMANPLPSYSTEENLRKTFSLLGLEIKELGDLGSYYEATLSSRLVVVIGKDKDFSSQVASLQFILNRSKIEGKIPTKIDLRFDKPVLKY